MAITLHTLPQASFQDVFNQVAIHLLTQNKRSEIHNPFKCKFACRYRGPDDTSCAVGCLMTDEEYNPKFEGRTVAGIYNVDTTLPPITIDLRKFLIELQQLHDLQAPKDWLDRLTILAEEFRLSMDTVYDYLHHKDSSDNAGESECPAS